jgi:hypothetical protein
MEKINGMVCQVTQNLKINKMEFIIGYLSGMFVMWVGAMSLKAQWKRDLEKLKDFETWKEWKNKN